MSVAVHLSGLYTERKEGRVISIQVNDLNKLEKKKRDTMNVTMKRVRRARSIHHVSNLFFFLSAS